LIDQMLSNKYMTLSFKSVRRTQWKGFTGIWKSLPGHNTKQIFLFCEKDQCRRTTNEGARSLYDTAL